MERILKVVPVDLRVKMEALVHDLTLALEESSNITYTSRRWGFKRRARSAGNIPSQSANKHSDDSSSSAYEMRVSKTPSSSKFQSDSDDTIQTKRFARFTRSNNASNFESDSVNENFAPRTNTRRKRKFKRMTIDSDSNPSTSQGTTVLFNPIGKKKRIFRNGCENWCGKRKRSCRERSTDCEMRSPKPNRASKSKNKNKAQSEDDMDCSRVSSSSISSSDSETRFVMNDEDREGDDEQSDWFGESSLWEDDGINEEKVSSGLSSQLIMQENSEHLSDEARKLNRQKIQWIRDGINGREIRAGRRHVDNKPGYSIITSANEKVSRFLQDPNQSELKLHPMHQPEREKLRRLANLYSLNLKGDLSCPILYKTRHTTQAVCVDQVSFNRFSDYKRLKKTPPNSLVSDSVMQNQEIQFSGTSLDLVMPNQNINSIQSSSRLPQHEWNTSNLIIDLPAKPKSHCNFGYSKSS